jgi:anti-anti-sigma factor
MVNKNKKDLTVTLDKTNLNAYRLILQGRMTTLTADTLKIQLDEAFLKGHINFIINMKSVSFLGSAGIRVLLMFFKKTKEAGGSFFVQEPSESVTNVLGMVALDEMLFES